MLLNWMLILLEVGVADAAEDAMGRREMALTSWLPWFPRFPFRLLGLDVVPSLIRLSGSRGATLLVTLGSGIVPSLLAENLPTIMH